MYTEETLEKHKKFFDSVIEKLNLGKIGNIVPVLHILPDAIPILYALNRVSDVPFVIPKPKSINRNVESSLGTDVKSLSRSEVNSDKFYETLPKEKTAFIDIGGYFADSVEEICNIQGVNFCGVVEDTENGLQKYFRNEISYPLISVARSPLKENED